VLATNPPANSITGATTDASGNALIAVNSSNEAVAQITGKAGDPNARGILDWALSPPQPMNTSQHSNVWSQLTWTPPPSVTTGANTGAAAGAAGAAVSNITLAKVNLNTAPRDVLIAIGLTEGEADSIISYRETNYDPTTKDNVAWVLDLLTDSKTAPPIEIATGQTASIGAFLTGTSTVYSAEIVTVSRDGRAFKRVKVVIDASSGTPHIIFRKDLTDAGWPLDPAIRDSLRSGIALPETGNTTAAPNMTMTR